MYNAEKYLHRCVDSILAQTCTDFELLLIDDGSNDKSPLICDEYASSDSRIHVFHKKNGGVSTARNMGLDNAKGEYVVFVDADDAVKNCYLSSFDTTVDFCQTSYVSKSNELCIPFPIKRMKFTRDIASRIIKHQYLIIGPWGKCFKKRIIEENCLRFEVNIHLGEDAIFIYNYLYKCKTASIDCSTTYYYYVGNENSLSKRKYSYDMMVNKWEADYKIVEKIFIKQRVWLEIRTYIVLNQLHRDYGISFRDIKDNPFLCYIAKSYLPTRVHAKLLAEDESFWNNIAIRVNVQKKIKRIFNRIYKYNAFPC